MKKFKEKKTQNKGEQYPFRFDEKGKNILSELQEKTELNRAQIIRHLLFEQKVPLIAITMEQQQMLSKLVMLGNLFNQAVKLAHQNKANCFLMEESSRDIAQILKHYLITLNENGHDN